MEWTTEQATSFWKVFKKCVFWPLKNKNRRCSMCKAKKGARQWLELRHNLNTLKKNVFFLCNKQNQIQGDQTNTLAKMKYSMVHAILLPPTYRQVTRENWLFVVCKQWWLDQRIPDRRYVMCLFTTVLHPHGHWQLQELLENLMWSRKQNRGLAHLKCSSTVRCSRRACFCSMYPSSLLHTPSCPSCVIFPEKLPTVLRPAMISAAVQEPVLPF